MQTLSLMVLFILIFVLVSTLCLLAKAIFQNFQKNQRYRADLREQLRQLGNSTKQYLNHSDALGIANALVTCESCHAQTLCSEHNANPTEMTRERVRQLCPNMVSIVEFSEKRKSNQDTFDA